jgi:hypothetical protein
MSNNYRRRSIVISIACRDRLESHFIVREVRERVFGAYSP